MQHNDDTATPRVIATDSHTRGPSVCCGSVSGAVVVAEVAAQPARLTHRSSRRHARCFQHFARDLPPVAVAHELLYLQKHKNQSCAAR
jgi:hypothetical protein